jgi:hypothetical protein
MLLSLPGDVKKLAANGRPHNHAKQGLTIMKPNDLYSTAHLFVAAVRVLDHREGAPPAIESVCRLLDYSEEKGSYLLNRFKEQGIVDTVKSGFNDRIVVGNHLAIEELPRDTEESRLEQELKKFKKGRDVMKEKVASIKAQHDQKKQDLFAEIEKKLKQKMEKK